MDVSQAVRQVLLEPTPMVKVRKARAVAHAWDSGELVFAFSATMPDRPAAPSGVEVLPPTRMKKRGKAGSARSRIALLHALAHIEFVAIDLAFDAAGRFGAEFPPAFVGDWLEVGADEAMHFALLQRRLQRHGAVYGDLPVHGGLWEAAEATREDALARLAVVPMVLEARGLDVTPGMIAAFEREEDRASAKVLSRIYRDEIRHVGTGTRWFRFGCEARRLAVVSQWQHLIRRHFRGSLKPPFNDSARGQAGLSREFYAALAGVAEA